MTRSARAIGVAEQICVGVLALWLIWLPLPFGSVVERARLPLVAIPLGLCCLASLVRLRATYDRSSLSQPTAAWAFWAAGAALLLVLGAAQLLPLPPSVLSLLSPESAGIWSEAATTARLAGVQPPARFGISVDPAGTAAEVVRVAALLAAFMAATLLVRTHQRRRVIALAIGAAAVFEVLYGVREAALGRYAIWGWLNRLVFNRVTGTYVNPNHFGHYLAIALPMTLFITASAWRRAAAPRTSTAQRVAALMHNGIYIAGFSVLAALACVAGILLSGSRGALLALLSAVLFAVACLPGRRVVRALFGATAAGIVVVSLVVFLGSQRTVARFVPTSVEQRTLVGRKIAIEEGLGVWRRFPLLGSGLGTYARVVSTAQQEPEPAIFHHAHNDYVEIAATAGVVGLLIVLISLAGGYTALLRTTIGEHAAELSWSRRAYQLAALSSLNVALVHALFDFNFFIPANAATLAVICGAAVAVTDHDRRTRR